MVWNSEIPGLTYDIINTFINNKNKILLDKVSVSGKNFFHYFFGAKAGSFGNSSELFEILTLLKAKGVNFEKAITSYDCGSFTPFNNLLDQHYDRIFEWTNFDEQIKIFNMISNDEILSYQNRFLFCFQFFLLFFFFDSSSKKKLIFKIIKKKNNNNINKKYK